MFYPQGESSDAGDSQVSKDNTYRIFSGPGRQGDSSGVNQDLLSAITSLNKTMQDSKMQIELTLVDSKTGERRTIVGNDGARVSTSMNFQ